MILHPYQGKDHMIFLRFEAFGLMLQPLFTTPLISFWLSDNHNDINHDNDDDDDDDDN